MLDPGKVRDGVGLRGELDKENGGTSADVSPLVAQLYMTFR